MGHRELGTTKIGIGMGSNDDCIARDHSSVCIMIATGGEMV